MVIEHTLRADTTYYTSLFEYRFRNIEQSRSNTEEKIIRMLQQLNESLIIYRDDETAIECLFTQFINYAPMNKTIKENIIKKYPNYSSIFLRLLSKKEKNVETHVQKLLERNVGLIQGVDHFELMGIPKKVSNKTIKGSQKLPNYKHRRSIHL